MEGDLEGAWAQGKRLDFGHHLPTARRDGQIGLGSSPRLLRKQCQTMMSARFARNSPTWSLARRRVNDVPPEATGMLPARWFGARRNTILIGP